MSERKKVNYKVPFIIVSIGWGVFILITIAIISSMKYDLMTEERADLLAKRFTNATTISCVLTQGDLAFSDCIKNYKVLLGGTSEEVEKSFKAPTTQESVNKHKLYDTIMDYIMERKK